MQTKHCERLHSIQLHLKYIVTCMGWCACPSFDRYNNLFVLQVPNICQQQQQQQYKENCITKS